jgi:hypothetical protein
MSDYTTTPRLGLFKPTFDADDDQWGNHWNANADILDAAVGTGGGGGASITISDTVPTIFPGALWFDSVGLQLYIGYNDGTSTQWVTANNQGLGGDFMFGITKTDRSGAITLGNQAQQLMAANTSRRGWSLQNKSTANLWFNDLGGSADPAANSSTYLPPGAYYESESNGASVTSVSLIGDATGAQYVCKEW